MSLCRSLLILFGDRRGEREQINLAVSSTLRVFIFDEPGLTFVLPAWGEEFGESCAWRFMCWDEDYYFFKKNFPLVQRKFLIENEQADSDTKRRFSPQTWNVDHGDSCYGWNCVPSRLQFRASQVVVAVENPPANARDTRRAGSNPQSVRSPDVWSANNLR